MRSKSFRLGLVALAILLFLVTLHRSQPAGRDGVEKTPTPGTGAAPSPTAAATANVEGFSCERPYSDSSVWNIPIDWSVAHIHPMSDIMMDAFFESDDWIGTDTSQFTPNM